MALGIFLNSHDSYGPPHLEKNIMLEGEDHGCAVERIILTFPLLRAQGTHTAFHTATVRVQAQVISHSYSRF